MCWIQTTPERLRLCVFYNNVRKKPSQCPPRSNGFLNTECRPQTLWAHFLFTTLHRLPLVGLLQTDTVCMTCWALTLKHATSYKYSSGSEKGCKNTLSHNGYSLCMEAYKDVFYFCFNCNNMLCFMCVSMQKHRFIQSGCFLFLFLFNRETALFEACWHCNFVIM